MSRPAEDRAMIGDGQTAALVARDGAVDRLCSPRFDHGACFAALLGTVENGCWRIAPGGEAGARVARRYRGDTLVLDSEFKAATGAVKLTDLAACLR